MEQNEILSYVRKHLAKRLCCTEEDFLKDGTIFVQNTVKTAPFLEICTMGKSVIVSSSCDIFHPVKELFIGKSRDEIFECPLIYGQSISYIPNLKNRREKVELSSDYEYELLQGKEIKKLAGINGFENSLAFDEHGETPTCIVFTARQNGKLVGLAGASYENDRMWEVGIDVITEYRGKGLATALVNHLVNAILQQGIVPFYCASTTNLGSQAVAQKCGLIPCWVSTFRTSLDGSSTYDQLLKGLHMKFTKAAVQLEKKRATDHKWISGSM